MNTHEKIQRFLNGNPFAVAGASNDRTKFGNKVLRAYIQTGRKAYPVNPTCQEVEGQKCYPDLAALPEQVHGLSIITPPKISKQIIEQAAKLQIPNIWLQPGAEDQEVIDLIEKLGLDAIHSGPCILVEFHNA